MKCFPNAGGECSRGGEQSRLKSRLLTNKILTVLEEEEQEGKEEKCHMK